MERVPSISLFLPKTKKGGKDGELVVSKIWWMRWRQNGKDTREPTGTRNRREAERRVKVKYEELERGEKAILTISWAQTKKESLSETESVSARLRLTPMAGPWRPSSESSSLRVLRRWMLCAW